jgi:hypothetical protein
MSLKRQTFFCYSNSKKLALRNVLNNLMKHQSQLTNHTVISNEPTGNQVTIIIFKQSCLTLFLSNESRVFQELSSINLLMCIKLAKQKPTTTKH